METPIRNTKCASSCRALKGVRCKLQSAKSSYYRGIKRVAQATLLLLAGTVRGSGNGRPDDEKTLDRGTDKSRSARGDTPGDQASPNPHQTGTEKNQNAGTEVPNQWDPRHDLTQTHINYYNEREKLAQRYRLVNKRYLDINPMMRLAVDLYKLPGKTSGCVKDIIDSDDECEDSNPGTSSTPISLAELFNIMITKGVQEKSEKLIDCGIHQVRKLGHGSYGDTYNFDDNRCLKRFVLNLKDCERPDQRELKRKVEERNILTMIREMWLMTFLEHENILSINEIPKPLGNIFDKSCEWNRETEIAYHDVLTYLRHAGGYMFTELMGGDLLSWKRKRSRKETTIPQIEAIACQVLKGVVYLRKAGVMHRDLKAKNILWKKGSEDAPQIKICDFGMSRYWDENSRPLTKRVCQFTCRDPLICKWWETGEKQYGFSCDVWSVGCLIVELLVSTPPRDLRRKEEPCKEYNFLSEDGIWERGNISSSRRNNDIIKFTDKLASMDRAKRQKEIADWIRNKNKYRKLTGNEPILELLSYILDPTVNRVTADKALHDFFPKIHDTENKKYNFEVNEELLERSGFREMEEEIKGMLDDAEELYDFLTKEKCAEEVHEKMQLIIKNLGDDKNDPDQIKHLFYAAKGISVCYKQLQTERARRCKQATVES